MSGKVDFWFGTGALAMLIYAVLCLTHGLVNGEKRMALRYGGIVTVTRRSNPGLFWFYSSVDLFMCGICFAFLIHFWWPNLISWLS